MDMNPTKASCSNGMNPMFFRVLWDLVGDKMFLVVKNIVEGNCPLPTDANRNSVVLIPKCSNPKYMNELRPMSLCNMLYRIFSKVLANRLKNVLSHVISANQSAFVPGRLITDNLLVVSEMLHFMKRKATRKRGWMI